MLAWHFEQAGDVRTAARECGAQQRIIDTAAAWKERIAADGIVSITRLGRMTNGQTEERPVIRAGNYRWGSQGQQSAKYGAGILRTGSIVNRRIREMVSRLWVAKRQERFRIPYRVDVDFPRHTVDGR